VDYSRSALDPLAVGHGQFLHAGWIYSHPAGVGGGCDFNPPDSRSKPSSLSQQFFVVSRVMFKITLEEIQEMNSEGGIYE
jgi:hypothetical protein